MNNIILYLLTKIACSVLKKYKPKVIAVTGTVGKTSTKEAIYAFLKANNCGGHFVHRSPKSFNGEWGVPLSILMRTSGKDDLLSKFIDVFASLKLLIRENRYPDVLVLEMGVNKPGEIPNLARWIQLDALVVTTISDNSPHLDEFKQPELILKDKASLVGSLLPTGSLILNADDPHTQYFIDKWKGRTILYGFSEHAEISAKDYVAHYTGSKISGFSFTLVQQNDSHSVDISDCLGIQHVYPILAAIAVGNVFHCDRKQFIEIYEPPPGRMRILRGIDDSVIIDDSFNASPIAAEKAILTIKETKAKRKIAAMSFMLGLEDRESKCHVDILESLIKTFDIVCLVGKQWETLLAGFPGREKTILVFESSIECGDYLKSILKDGDLVLVKGSQASRMERVVSKIISDAYSRTDVLVRQEDYWLKIK